MDDTITLIPKRQIRKISLHGNIIRYPSHGSVCAIHTNPKDIEKYGLVVLDGGAHFWCLDNLGYLPKLNMHEGDGLFEVTTTFNNYTDALLFKIQFSRWIPE